MREAWGSTKEEMMTNALMRAHVKKPCNYVYTIRYQNQDRSRRGFLMCTQEKNTLSLIVGLRTIWL